MLYFTIGLIVSTGELVTESSFFIKSQTSVHFINTSIKEDNLEIILCKWLIVASKLIQAGKYNVLIEIS